MDPNVTKFELLSGPQPTTTAPKMNELCTIVTGLFNLGRERWKPPYHREWRYYLRHFRKTLSLRCNMVIYVESGTVEFVKRVRSNVDPDMSHTVIDCISISDLPAFKYLPAISSIMQKNKLQSGLVSPFRPETYIPIYSCVIHSKTGLVKKAIDTNIFGTKYFMWTDAGLCREQFPNSLRWVILP
jgi:Bacterial protein of unknown function (HtrL_YibB)